MTKLIFTFFIVSYNNKPNKNPVKDQVKKGYKGINDILKLNKLIILLILKLKYLNVKLE